MTTTVLSSATREVVIGFDRPFVMIGERINPTGRKLLAEEMVRGDFSRVEADAVAQVGAGAHMLDVNAGIPLADEPALLARAIQLVQSVTDVPLSIDSSIVEALEAGLAVYQGKPLVNSVTGEDEVMERVLPLVARHGAAVVAISNDETGISEDPDVRYSIAKRIVERAADHGIPANDVVVDPLVMPIGAMGTAGRQAFTLIRRLREELKVNTTCGGSNISFGLPNRQLITGTFLAMAIASGMTSAIMSPLHPEVRSAVLAADVLSGADRDCAAWIRANRDPEAGRRAGPAPRATSRERVMMHRVVFTPSGLEGKVTDGTTVLEAARQLGADLDTVCGGRGICGRCQVTPSIGRFAKWHLEADPDALGTAGDHRARLPRPPPARRRQPSRDVPPASSATSSSTCLRAVRFIARSCARTLQLASVTVDPRFRLYFVEVAPARARRQHECRSGADRHRRRPASGADTVARPPVAAGDPPRARRRSRRGDRGGVQRRRRACRDDRRRMAWLRRRRLRGGDRHRLDDRRRPPVRPVDR